MYAWVPDGIYDHPQYYVRYKMVDGMPTHIITKSWIEVGGPSDITGDMIMPWGTYPEFPPKPEKKK